MTFDTNRPNPDQLLAQMQAEDARARRGRLRVYFGASAGVGKTYAMLSAAQRERKAGREVLVGVVETHGRSETAALLEGLEQLPLLPMGYRGRVLHEFDIDAALARKPAVLLVDELAHTNVEGARHAKRWQDVRELLDAGIDVWTALNVQHLESLNGTVGAITGVRVHETVPDTVLEQADEMVLVDVTPDELLARLKAGKVYLPQQAERAAQNFFRKGNLIALREIALRQTAEHVEDDVRSWRVEQSHDPSAAAAAWGTSGALLVCVGPDAGAEQAVRHAARLAGSLNVRWYAAYVETPRLQRLAAPVRDRVLAVLQLAAELGAETAVLTDSDVAVALVRQANALNCSTLVMGRRTGPSPLWRVLRPTMVRRIAQLAPALVTVETGQSDSVRRLARSVQSPPGDPVDGGWRSNWPGYAGAVAASALTTLVAWPLNGLFDQANIVMVFLLGVVLVAVKLGRGPAVLAAVLNVLVFDFFFVTPRFSFAVSDVQYLVTFGVMLLVGLLTAQLTAGLRFQARIAAGREQRAQALFTLSRDLSSTLLAEQVAELGQAAVQRSFGGEVRVLTTDDRDALVVATDVRSGLDASVADWAFRNGQSAGLATATLSAHAWHYVPLLAPMRTRGVLALKPAQPRWLLIPEQRQQLDTLARQIAIALERVHYVQVAQQAVVRMESERLRNTLLAAISHDVRTPLTALMGLADALARSQPALVGAQADMAQAITSQARQLYALVLNLLDMARLQSGEVNLRREWQSVEEVVGAAIRAAQPGLQGLPVATALEPDIPLVEFDGVLVERALVNLLENAAKYGAPPIVVGARTTADTLVLTVRDHGPGLPAVPSGQAGEVHDLFEKFTRGTAESSTPGVGLGLAICKAVAVAHGGSITAGPASPDGWGGGAEFTLTLPRRPPPEVPGTASALLS